MSDDSGAAVWIGHGVKKGRDGEVRVCSMSGPGDASAHRALTTWAGPKVTAKGDGLDITIATVFDGPEGRRTPTTEELNNWSPAVADHLAM